MFEELTPEQELQKSFDSAMDSVNLILGDKPVGMTVESWDDVVARNKEHLNIVIKRDAFTEEQIAQLKTAL